MQSRSVSTKSHRLEIIVAVSGLLVVSLAYKLKMPDGILNDPFHHGEYFASLATLLSGQQGQIPLTIHGALDYLPGLVALKAFGQDTYFFPTWLIYQLLGIAAAIMLYLLAVELSKNKPYSFFVPFALALSAPFLVDYRDVMLLLSIHLYFSIQKAETPLTIKLLETCLGVTLGTGLFWSFDRGIAAAISLGTACLIQAARNRRYLLSISVFIVIILSMGLVSPQLSLSNYFENIKILFETSHQWSYGWQAKPIALTSLLGLANGLALLFLSLSIPRQNPLKNHLPDNVFLILLSLIFFKIGSNRADTIHILMGLWPPLLASLYWHSLQPRSNPGLFLQIALTVFLASLLTISYKLRITALLPIAAMASGALFYRHRFLKAKPLTTGATAFTLAAPLLISLHLIAKGQSTQKYDWIHYLHSPPANQTLVTDGVRWAAQELLSSGSNCIFDLSNNGLINGLTALPACSRFTYPVYADRRYEEEMIDALRRRGPKAIIYSSSNYAFRIDGKTMHARFPELASFLQSKYQKEKCSFDYCMRYLKG